MRDVDVTALDKWPHCCPLDRTCLCGATPGDVEQALRAFCCLALASPASPSVPWRTGGPWPWHRLLPPGPSLQLLCFSTDPHLTPAGPPCPWTVIPSELLPSARLWFVYPSLVALSFCHTLDLCVPPSGQTPSRVPLAARLPCSRLLAGKSCPKQWGPGTPGSRCHVCPCVFRAAS